MYTIPPLFNSSLARVRSSEHWALHPPLHGLYSSAGTPCFHSSSTGIRLLLLMSLTSVPHPLSSFIFHKSLFVRATGFHIHPSPSLRICSSPSGLYIRPPVRPSTHVWRKLITYLWQRSPHPLLVIKSLLTSKCLALFPKSQSTVDFSLLEGAQILK